MAYSLFVEPDAASDLANAFVYYEQQRSGLGREFLSCVDDVFTKLRENPRLFAKAYKSVRQALVRRFPFIVCYIFENDRVNVIAVFHGRRDPKDWKSRVSPPS